MVNIEREREWWAKNGESVFGFQSKDIAGEYLDELEATRNELNELNDDVSFALSEAKRRLPDYPWDTTGPVAPKIVWALGESLLGTQDANDDLHETIASLRAQLADQRARDIRAAALFLWHSGLVEAKEDAISSAASDYDRLAAIPVPPPAKEVERG